jgi:hypothetical protein
VAIIIVLDPCDKDRQRSLDIWSVLEPQGIIEAINNRTFWSLSRPALADAVHMSIEETKKNGRPLGPSLIAVSTPDLVALSNGTSFLSGIITQLLVDSQRRAQVTPHHGLRGRPVPDPPLHTPEQVGASLLQTWNSY